MPRITPIPARRLQRLFEKAGFKCVRTEGDHYVYTKKGVAKKETLLPDKIWQAGLPIESFY